MIIQEGHKFDFDQYLLLKSCSENKDLSPWNSWRDEHCDEEIWLQGANFDGFYLEGANFIDAHCDGASFVQAKCKGANFCCAFCDDTNFSGTFCESAFFNGAHLRRSRFHGATCIKTIFDGAHCEEAHFYGARCQNAVFTFSHCENAFFEKAKLHRAKFIYSHCQGTRFLNAICRGTNFYGARVNSETVLIGSDIDDNTNFSCSSLASVMIEPSKRVKLEHNIRRILWNEWCGSRDDSGLSDIEKSIVKSCYPNDSTTRKVLTFPVRLFWLISDYGYSTTRVFLSFAFILVVFASIYTVFPEILQLDGKNSVYGPCESLVSQFIKMLFFSFSTMVTLGFSNINVANLNGNLNGWGMLTVSMNLMVGYFMLAVLASRFAILFQNLSPGYIVPPESKDDSR